MIFFQNDCALVLMISLVIIFSLQSRSTWEERYRFHNHEESWNKKHAFEAEVDDARQRLKREGQQQGIVTGIKERYFKKHAKAIFGTANILKTSRKMK